MMQPVEFRASSTGGETLPLIVGWGMGVVPLAVQGFAFATGQLHKMLGPEPPDWPTIIAIDLALLFGFGGCGTLLYLWSVWGRKRAASSFRVRMNRDGLEFSYKGRTHRMPWNDLRVEYQPGDEDTGPDLVFHSSTGSFSYPWWLNAVDYADFVAILRVKVPRLILADAHYTPEIHGMLVGLEEIMRKGEPKQMPYAERLCHQIVAKAEKKSQLQYGMMPVLYACQRAFEQMGKKEEAGALAFRLQTLLSQLQ